MAGGTYGEVVGVTTPMGRADLLVDSTLGHILRDDADALPFRGCLDEDLGPSPRRPVDARRTSFITLDDSPEVCNNVPTFDGADGCTRAVASNAPVLERRHGFDSSSSPKGVPSQSAWLHAQMAQSLQALESVKTGLLGGETVAAVVASSKTEDDGYGKRHDLLDGKKSLATAMEQLRATMRNLQENGEMFMTQERASAADHLAVESVQFATQDELRKTKSQLGRSREQSEEHRGAKTRLKQQLEACAIAFGEAIQAESEAQEAMRQEIDQLGGVNEDLDLRLKAKMAEVEKLKAVNGSAIEKSAVFAGRWRAARGDCSAAFGATPLGPCANALKEMIQAVSANSLSPSVAPELPRSLREVGSPSGICKVPAKIGDNAANFKFGEVTAPANVSRETNNLQQELKETIHEQLWQGFSRSGTGSASAVAGSASESSWPPDERTLQELVSRKEEQLATLHRKIRYLSETVPFN